jgi:hypothetical protein
MAPATALASDDDSVMDMKVTDLIQGDRTNALYPYWVHTNGTKTTFTEKDSIELEDGTKISPSEGQWLIRDADADSGDIQFVPRYVEPEVYMIPDRSDESNIKKVALKEADSDGMAEVSQDDWNTEELTFFSGMDFKVRKTVDKLGKGSFKVSVTGKDGTDYTNYFYFYLSESCSQYWGKWIKDDRYMLGGIPDNKVKIYIMPLKDLLRVKAGVAGKGGSITPTDKYYLASDTGEKEYTVAPDPGYKVDKVEYTNAEGTTGDVRLNQSTDKYMIYPSKLGQDTAGTTLRTAYIKAYFKSGHTHCICGGETFDGHETHTAELDWIPWTSTTSLPDEAGNYFLQSNVTLPSGKVTLPDGVNLCLNGKSVTGEDASGTKLAVTGRGTLTVTDCGDGSFGNMTVAEDSKLVMYGGRIDGVVKINSGVTFTMTGRTQNEGIISVYGDARFAMEGEAKNNVILRLYETSSDSRIVFGGHADSSGTIEIEQPQEGVPVRVEDSAQIRLLSSPTWIKIRLTAKDDAVVGEVENLVFSDLNLSGNAKLGSKISYIELQGEYSNIRDNAQLIGSITYCCAEDGNVLTLQDQTKIIGSLTMKKVRDDSNIKGTLIMKDDSTIQGGLSCAEDTISFEMQDNATIDGNIAVADSKVNGKFTCTGEIYSGIFYGDVVADGIIQGGTFFGKVTGRGQINDTAMCSVVFTINGLGTDTQKVLRGQKVGEPVLKKGAIQEGYIFGGWYNGGVLYDFSTPVLGDIVLMASIIPCDHSGNSSKATCKDKAKCEVCGQSYGELDAANHTNLVNVPAKAATKTEEGNIEYWYCDGCSKYFSDKDGTKEIKLADTVVEKLKDDGNSSQTVTEDPWKKSDADLGITVATVPNKQTTTTTKETAKKTTKKATKKAVSAKTTRKETAKKTAQTTKFASSQNNTKSPQTGDDSNPVLWMVWMLVSGCALMGLSVRGRRRKEENK